MIVPIFFTFDKWYTLAAEVAFYSLLKNGSSDNDYRLYVLSDSLPDSSRSRIRSVVSKFPNATLEFRDVSAYERKYQLPQGRFYYSKEIFYKLVAADVFPEYDYILCSDVDVIFENDVVEALTQFSDSYFSGISGIIICGEPMSDSPLYSQEEREKLAGGIGAGFLLMNLENVRRDHLQERMVMFYLNNFHRLLQPEQDTITLCAHPYISYLDWKFCVLNFYYKMDDHKIDFKQPSIYAALNGDRTAALAHFKHTLQHPVQIHYVGCNKPWNRLFVPLQGRWINYVWQAGLLWQFLTEFPSQFFHTFRRYSLRRFINRHLHSNI